MTLDEVLANPIAREALDAFVAQPNWTNETKLANTLREILLNATRRDR